MALKKADVSKFDRNGSGDINADIFGLPFTPDECNIVLIPVPWEVTASYGRGTAKGPQAIRSASPQLDLFDPQYAELGMVEPWEFGIHMEPERAEILQLNQRACNAALPIIEAGGVAEAAPGFVKPALVAALASVNEASISLNELVEQRVSTWLDRGKLVGVVGGDHSVSFGAIRAHARRNPGLGVLHVDAHADLRVAYEGFEYSHASIMYNVLAKISDVKRIVQVGIRDLCEAEYGLTQRHPKLKTWFDHEVRGQCFAGTSFREIVNNIVSSLPDKVYVSFDIDGLSPELCPNTGTPVPGGLTFAEAGFILRQLACSGRKIVGFDLTEVAPSRKEPDDQWNGNVGARVLYKLCAATLFSNDRDT